MQRGPGDANRNELEQRSFSIAISRMQLWYAHQKTLVYLLTRTPAAWDGAGSVPYSGRGWPTFERTVSMLLKLQSSKCWSNLVDVGEPDARLRPPKTVDEFKRLLQQLKFTNGADRRVVA